MCGYYRGHVLNMCCMSVPGLYGVLVGMKSMREVVGGVCGCVCVEGHMFTLVCDAESSPLNKEKQLSNSFVSGM